MRIKHIIKLVFLSCILLPNICLSQNKVEADERLSVIYTQEDIARMEKMSDSNLSIQNFKLDNAWFLPEEYLSEKLSSSPYLCYVDKITGKSSGVKVTDIDFENINIAEYYYEMKYSKPVYYKIGDSGNFIGFYSIKEFVELYNYYNEKE